MNRANQLGVPALSTLLFAIGLSVAACTVGTDASDVAQAQVVAWIDRGTAPLLIDVRTPEEYASGHVPGAVNIPHDQLGSRVNEIEAHRDQEVVVYCERGGRAANAAETLEAAGFTTIRHLSGDMSAWRDAGLPTE